MLATTARKTERIPVDVILTPVILEEKKENHVSFGLRVNEILVYLKMVRGFD